MTDTFRRSHIPVPQRPDFVEEVSKEEVTFGEAPKAEEQPQESQQDTAETTEPQQSDEQATPGDKETGLQATVKRCPRCYWEVDKELPVEVTDADMERFLIAAATGNRFTKTYTLIPDQRYITFRTLLTVERRKIEEQVRRDLVQGKLLSEADFLAANTRYRLPVQVECITDADGNRLVEVPPLIDMPEDKPSKDGDESPSVLERAVDWFEREVCRTESLHRITCDLFRQFMLLVETLEVRGPDFTGPTKTAETSSTP